MNRSKNKEGAYIRAMNKVNRLRGFYVHLVVYFVVNTAVSIFKIFRNLQNGESFEMAFFEFSTFALWTFWGIGLALHAFNVFGMPMIMGENWEEEKIKQYMEEEERTGIKN